MTKRSSIPKLEALLRFERSLNSSGHRFVAGVDEAGRGPLAGPVVASAVILKNYDFCEEIDDSKKLSAKKRELAYREIIDNAIVGIGIESEKVIDRLNIYQATIRAMQKAVQGLEIPPDYVIVDGRIRLPTKCPLRCVVGGDGKCLSIAAASIVAKVTRDRLMVEYDRRYPQYGFAMHKGYGTKYHKSAIEKYGASPIHRLSFQPLKSLNHLNR